VVEMRSSLLLTTLIGVMTASSILHVYHPSKFDQSPRCAPCRPSHVCLISSTHIECIDRIVAMKKITNSKFVEYGTAQEKFGGKKDKILSGSVHNGLGHKEVCSMDEVNNIGARLLLWSSQIHSKYAGIDVSLPSHSIPCRPETAWIFSQFDGDNDGFLNPTELTSLEGGKRERCLTQFIDHCDDITIDGLISIDEWCDCLSFSLDPHHEPLCHKKRHSVDPHAKDAFLPHCDIDGFFSPSQCHKGECWCVDKYGREMDGSRVHKALPDCRQYAVKITDAELQDLKTKSEM
ncbi:test-1, partial [Pristionchus pacificus]